MARKAKLEGADLEQFLKDRSSGRTLKDLSFKYGLTASRLCQIYKANTAHPVQIELPIERSDE